MSLPPSEAALIRIADALERLSPAARPAPEFTQADAFVWHTGPDRLVAVPHVSRVALALLVGVDRVRDILLANTLQFAAGLPANLPRGLDAAHLTPEAAETLPVGMRATAWLPVVGFLASHPMAKTGSW